MGQHEIALLVELDGYVNVLLGRLKVRLCAKFSLVLRHGIRLRRKDRL